MRIDNRKLILLNSSTSVNKLLTTDEHHALVHGEGDSRFRDRGRWRSQMLR